MLTVHIFLPMSMTCCTWPAVKSYVIYINLYIFIYNSKIWWFIEKIVPQYLKIELSKKFDDIPMILNEGFNVNFADDRSLPLTEFLHEAWSLTISNDGKLSTTSLVSVSFLECNKMIERTNNLSNVKINDDNNTNNEKIQILCRNNISVY